MCEFILNTGTLLQSNIKQNGFMEEVIIVFLVHLHWILVKILISFCRLKIKIFNETCRPQHLAVYMLYQIFISNA